MVGSLTGDDCCPTGIEDEPPSADGDPGRLTGEEAAEEASARDLVGLRATLVGWVGVETAIDGTLGIVGIACVTVDLTEPGLDDCTGWIGLIEANDEKAGARLCDGVTAMAEPDVEDRDRTDGDSSPIDVESPAREELTPKVEAGGLIGLKLGENGNVADERIGREIVVGITGVTAVETLCAVELIGVRIDKAGDDWTTTGAPDDESLMDGTEAIDPVG